MARAPKSPLVAIIAYFMNAPIEAAKQGLETAKTIIHEREQAGLREPVLPLKSGKKGAGPTPGALRAKKAREAKKAAKTAPETAGTVAGVTASATTAAAPPLTGIQAEAAAKSPRRRPRLVAPPSAATPLVDPAPAGLPDQAVDETHEE